MCLLTNERYITYLTGFSIGRLIHAPRVGLGGTGSGGGGSKIYFYSKFNQILCVYYSHEWHVQRHTFLGPCPLGRGKKGKVSFIKSISKISKPNFVCLLTNERYITYQMGFYSVTWVMPQGWDLEVHLGCQNSTKFGLRVTHMNGILNVTMFWPPPTGTLRGQKVEYH